MRRIHFLLILFFCVGCISDNPEFKRISTRSPFILQFGAITKPRVDSNFLLNDQCNAITVDRFENILCAGSTFTNLGEAKSGLSTVGDSFIMKLDKFGKILWITQLGVVTKENDNTGNDSCASLITDTNGNVYCGGVTDGSTSLGAASFGGVTDGFVLKLNSNGKLIWISQFGTNKDDVCNDVQLSPDGLSVYCGGITTGEFSAGLNPGLIEEDSFVIKLQASNGDIVTGWPVQLSSYDVTLSSFFLNANSTNLRERGRSIAVSSSGLITLVGNTASSLTETISMGSDIFLWQINPDGETRSLKQYGADYIWSDDLPNVPRTIRLDSDGNFFIGADIFRDPLKSNIQMLKINGISLEPIWQNEVDDIDLAPGFSSSEIESCEDTRIDKYGSSYCFGYTTGNLADSSSGARDLLIVKFSPSGPVSKILHFGTDAGLKLDRDFSFNEIIKSGWIDSDGNIYVTGVTQGSFGEMHSSEGTNDDVFIFRLEPDLNISDLKI